MMASIAVAFFIIPGKESEVMIMEKIKKQVLGGKDKVRVAAIQCPQVVFNKDKSLDIICSRIKEAGANGARLVAFSESVIPVFPAYYSAGYASNDKDEYLQWMLGMQDNSIALQSEEMEMITNACRDAGTYCVIGINELDATPGSRTIFNTNVLIGSDGKILGTHRKLKPTFNERIYWGEGDGADYGAYDTSIGRIGTLICYEHHTLLIKAAQALLGEEFHIANYPGTWKAQGPLLINRNEDPMAEGSDVHRASREYAFEGGCFVIAVNGLLRPEDFEPGYENLATSRDMAYDYACGGSCIIDPFGEYITKPVFNEDTIIYGDCCANDIKVAKMMFDGLGHYSKASAVRLYVDRTHYENFNELTPSSFGGNENAYLKELSQKYEVALEKIEKLAAKIEEA